jgi:hypothetical protein
MGDFTIAIYCFLDDFLKKMQTKALDSRRKLNDAQVLSTVLIAARYFYGNHTVACDYMRTHWGFEMPDKSNFNRVLHQNTELLLALFYHLSAILKHLNIESVYVIDSFPIPVCKNIRIARSKLVKGKEFRGYNASKKEYFYGFKVHLISTADGLPVEFMVSPASTHDNTALQMMPIDLPEKSHLYGDAAYLNQEEQALLLEFKEIYLKAATKKTQKYAILGQKN